MRNTAAALVQPFKWQGQGSQPASVLQMRSPIVGGGVGVRVGCRSRPLQRGSNSTRCNLQCAHAGVGTDAGAVIENPRDGGSRDTCLVGNVLDGSGRLCTTANATSMQPLDLQYGIRGISCQAAGWASDMSSDTTCFRDRVKGLGGVCTHPPLALFRAASRRKMTIVRTLVRTSGWMLVFRSGSLAGWGGGELGLDCILA